MSRLKISGGILCILIWAACMPCLAQWATSGNYLYTGSQVGVGIAGPETQLHVHSATPVLSSGSGGGFKFRDQKGDAQPNTDDWAWFAQNNLARLHKVGVGDLMTITTSGNMGIGVANAQSKLHIDGISEVLSTGQGAGFKFRSRSSGAQPNTDDWVWYAQDNVARLHKVGSGDLMNVTNSGNIGIGTTNPGTFKLAVEGKIGAREVVVKTGSWADFVFSPTYRLPSLSALESYINEHRHLPDIPSEEQVKTNGYELGSMDAKLLQKIEELTLYIIDQQKRIDQLEKRCSVCLDCK